MRILVSDATAEHLLDFLASDGVGGRWASFAELGDWESPYNLRHAPYFIGRLARNLAARRLAEVRRAALGMQMCLTPAGIAPGGTTRTATNAWAMIDVECFFGILAGAVGGLSRAKAVGIDFASSCAGCGQAVCLPKPPVIG